MSASPNDSLLLAACGDMMLYGRYQGLVEAGQADWVLDPFRALTADADLLVANLENPLAHTDVGAPRPDKLCLRADPRWAEALARAGVDVVNLANNHVMDYGAEALAQTRRHLAAAGVKATGAGADLKQAGEPVIIERNGLRLGLLGACDASTKPGPVATPRTAGVAPARADWLLAAIEGLKARVDQVVLMLHWGLEYSPLPTPEQVALARAAIERGAGLILGHHSHCIQGIEHFRGGIIAYGLANLTDDRVDVRTAERHYLAELTETDREAFLLRACVWPDRAELLEPLPLWLDDEGRPGPAAGARAEKIRARLAECSRLLKDTPDLGAYWEAQVIERRVAAPLLSWWRDGSLWDKVRRFRPGQIVSAWLLLTTYLRVRLSRSQSRWLLYNERNDTRPMPAAREPRDRP